MPQRYTDRVAQALSQIKDEEEVWGESTAAMQRKLKDLLEGILEGERDSMVAREWYKRGQSRRDHRSGYRTRTDATISTSRTRRDGRMVLAPRAGVPGRGAVGSGGSRLGPRLFEPFHEIEVGQPPGISDGVSRAIPVP